MRSLGLLSLALCAAALLSACGGSAGSGPQAPVFTSTPVTAAAQDTVYSYQLAATDPAGGAVTFSLSAAPASATLSGNTLTWTPSAAQSRVANNFKVTASTPSGGSASQSWMVTPTGTITVTFINTLWGPNGSTHASTRPTELVMALAPQPDGSFVAMPSTAVSPGVWTIANVPAGHYWLLFQPGPVLGAATGFWTSTSNFDDGSDIAGSPLPILSSSQSTMFNLELTGLDAAPAGGGVAFVTDLAGIPATFVDAQEATTLSDSFTLTDPLDWSQVHDGFLLQLEPVSAGSLNLLALGPELTLSNLNLTSGTTNQIAGGLQSGTQASLHLGVQGSQWAPLFQNIGPVAATLQSSWLSLQAEPFVTGRNANTGLAGPNLFMLLPNPSGTTLTPATLPGACQNIPFFLPPLGMDKIVTDQDFGTVQYDDPFPAGWTRAQTFCQGATLTMSLPVGTASVNFPIPVLNAEAVVPSNSPLVPIAAPVLNPTVNGTSLFTPTTLNTTAVTLAWSAPTAGTPPFGYKVLIMQIQPLSGSLNGIEIMSAGAYATAQTSITLPPQVPGQVYLFLITTAVDAVANMETSPNRSALPTGFATIVSAPITIAPGATSPIIVGDVKDFSAIAKARTATGLSSKPAHGLQ
jgi:hypothetical protein